MKTKSIRYILIILGMVIALILPICGMFFIEEIVVGEKLCVDGIGAKNLEGFMCEDRQYIILGMSLILFSLFSVLLGISGLIIYTIGLFLE